MALSKAKSGKPAKKAAASNRRRFDRRDTRIAAELDDNGHVTRGTVTNLSLAGCLFEPRIDIALGARVKLKLAGETPVAATVKAVSDQGVHCLLHAGGVTLGRLSADLDDMALLMLNAGRPHEITPPALKSPTKPAAPKKKAAKKIVKKKAAVKKKAVKKAVKKVVKKKAAAKRPVAKKKVARARKRGR